MLIALISKACKQLLEACLLAACNCVHYVIGNAKCLLKLIQTIFIIASLIGLEHLKEIASNIRSKKLFDLL